MGRILRIKIWGFIWNWFFSFRATFMRERSTKGSGNCDKCKMAWEMSSLMVNARQCLLNWELWTWKRYWTKCHSTFFFLLKLAFSCQICALHLILVLLQAKTKFILVLELEQCCCPKQKINQVAMIKPVVIIEVMGNIHTDYNFLKEISCEL